MKELYSVDLVQDISINAKLLLNNYDEATFFDSAIDDWIEINSKINQVRPIGSDILDFLKSVSTSVILELKDKYEVITVVTMNVVVRQILDTLINEYEMQNIILYKIPIQLLAAIIFTKILDEASKRLQ